MCRIAVDQDANAPFSDLEKAVEGLSQLLDEPVDEESVKSLRQRMMDKTVCRLSLLLENTTYSYLTQVYVRGRHEIVLQDTAEGLYEGRWEWSEPLD